MYGTLIESASASASKMMRFLQNRSNDYNVIFPTVFFMGEIAAMGLGMVKRPSRAQNKLLWDIWNMVKMQ